MWKQQKKQLAKELNDQCDDVSVYENEPPDTPRRQIVYHRVKAQVDDDTETDVVDHVVVSDHSIGTEEEKVNQADDTDKCAKTERCQGTEGDKEHGNRQECGKIDENDGDRLLVTNRNDNVNN